MTMAIKNLCAKSARLRNSKSSSCMGFKDVFWAKAFHCLAAFFDIFFDILYTVINRILTIWEEESNLESSSPDISECFCCAYNAWSSVNKYRQGLWSQAGYSVKDDQLLSGLKCNLVACLSLFLNLS